MSVSLVEVMVAASRRLAPLSGECAGHAVLAAADQLLSNPRLIGAAEVLIEESGTVRLAGGRASDERGCDQGLRGLLDGLLTVAHSGGVGLFRVGQRTGSGDLGQLVRELEVALIPANRAAARRSLARLHRETERARDAGRLERASDALPGHSVPREREREREREPAPPLPSRAEVEVPERTLGADAVLQAHASAYGSGAELSASELDLLAVTQVRFATGPRLSGAAGPELASSSVEPDFAIDVDVDVSAPQVEAPVQRTQPLPKVAARRELHETVPLPPVSTEPRIRAEHETPLEPVLGRRHGGQPARHEPADIHKTPYLGTLVATAPLYDPEPRAAWRGETWPMPEASAAAAAPDATSPADWEADDSTTDPAPVVAWSAADDVAGGLAEDAAELALVEGDSADAAELALAEGDSADAAELALAEGDSADAAELTEDDITELTEDDITELAADDVMELALAEEGCDDITELVEAPPLAGCAALAVQPRVSAPLEPKPPRVPRTSDVEDLLERFRVAEPEPDPQLARGLKQLAGITLTPPPVLARTEGGRIPPEFTSTPAAEPARSELGAAIRPVPTVRIVGS